MTMVQRIARRLKEPRSKFDAPGSDGGWPACRAPHVALRFSPTGVVRACCANDKVVLGTAGGDSLREIWEGQPIRDLAAAIESGDYSHGCDDCAPGIVSDRDATPAANFDRFPPQPRSRWPLRLEFALSNRCNLQCVMCNGELSSSIRIQREGRSPLPAAYGRGFFEEIRPFLLHAREVAFIGGEPFLEPGCRKIWDQLIELGATCSVHVTTNGTIGGERVERYLQALRMEVAMSIDAATPDLFEEIRVGASYDTVIANRDRFLQLCRGYSKPFAINFCLMTSNWQELHLMCLEADRLDVELQVIPVFWPADFSLLCLPDAELASIVDELDRIGKSITEDLRRNRLAWDGTIDMLRDHVRRAARNEIPVALRVRQIGRPAPLDLRRGLQALADWSVWDPIEFSGSPDADALTAALERWLGPRTHLERTAENPDHNWQATFATMAGTVTVRVARLGSANGDEQHRTAIAFDRDPSTLIPADVDTILAVPTSAEAEAHHEGLLAPLADELEGRFGIEVLRLDLADDRVTDSVLPAWMAPLESGFVGQRASEVVLPRSDKPPVTHRHELFGPLTTTARVTITARGRSIDGDLFMVRRLDRPDYTVLLAPSEIF